MNQPFPFPDALHGDLFEFDRNAVFNARNFFAPKHDRLKRNQFGGALGGPVVIPKLYNGKNKTFFFTGYQGTRIRNIGNTSSEYAPTASDLTEDFSAFLSASNPNNPLGKATAQWKLLEQPAVIRDQIGPRKAPLPSVP